MLVSNCSIMFGPLLVFLCFLDVPIAVCEECFGRVQKTMWVTCFVSLDQRGEWTFSLHPGFNTIVFHTIFGPFGIYRLVVCILHLAWAMSRGKRNVAYLLRTSLRPIPLRAMPRGPDMPFRINDSEPAARRSTFGTSICATSVGRLFVRS